MERAAACGVRVCGAPRQVPPPIVAKMNLDILYAMAVHEGSELCGGTGGCGPQEDAF